MEITKSAFAEAARYGDDFVGTHHLLMALLTETSIVTDALAEQDVTYDRVAEFFCQDILRVRDVGARAAGGGLSPDASEVHGRAQGIAIARGLIQPRAEEWILAMVYSPAGMGFPLVLQVLGASRSDLIGSLRRRGVEIPDAELPPLDS
jgi:hypothetical protein